MSVRTPCVHYKCVGTWHSGVSGHPPCARSECAEVKHMQSAVSSADEWRRCISGSTSTSRHTHACDTNEYVRWSIMTPLKFEMMNDSMQRERWRCQSDEDVGEFPPNVHTRCSKRSWLFNRFSEKIHRHTLTSHVLCPNPLCLCYFLTICIYFCSCEVACDQCAHLHYR